MVSGHQLQMIMCLLEAKSRSRLSFLHDCCHKPFATVSCHPCNFLALDPLNRQPLQRGRERERMIHHVRIVSLTVAPQWCMSHPTLGKSQIVSGIVVASARFNRLRGFIGIKGVEKSPGRRQAVWASTSNTVFLFNIRHSNISCPTAKITCIQRSFSNRVRSNWWCSQLTRRIKESFISLFWKCSNSLWSGPDVGLCTAALHQYLKLIHVRFRERVPWW